MAQTLLVLATAIGILLAHSLPAASADISLGQLRTRDARITLLASASGPRFTVHSPDGTLLAKRLTEAQLARELPKIYERIRSSVASTSEGARPLEWAGCTACDGFAETQSD